MSLAHRSSGWLLVSAAGLALLLAGCQRNSDSSTAPATHKTEPSTVQPAATISGLKPATHFVHIKKLANGLVLEDIKLGTGPKAADGAEVTVNYTGWLKNGKIFDSSHLPGRTPFKFRLGAGQVIPGWDIGVAGMRQGGIRQLVIPATLAYGAGGSPPTIPPDATLTFRVHLLNAGRVSAAADVAGASATQVDTTGNIGKKQAVNAAAAEAQPAKPLNLKPSTKFVDTKKLADGLVIEDVRIGKGPQPKAGDKVTVNYTGWLKNDKIFDSSHLPGRTPFQFRLGAGQVIPGWDIGVATMHQGGIRQLIIPADLAYGPDGMPPTIPPDATLIFRIHLLVVSPTMPTP